MKTGRWLVWSTVFGLGFMLSGCCCDNDGSGDSTAASGSATPTKAEKPKDIPHPNGAACKGIKNDEKCSACCSTCCGDGPLGMSAGNMSPETGCECRKRW